MRRLDTITWELRARTRRLRILSTPASHDSGPLLEEWIHQMDLWTREVSDRRLVDLCRAVLRNSRECEHRVLASTRDTVTLLSRIDPSAARDRLGFLADVGGFLGSSVDVSTLVAAATRLAVPQLADWCVLRLSPLSGSTTRLLVGHLDPALERRIHQIEQRRHVGARWPGTLLGDGYALTPSTGAEVGAGGESRPPMHGYHQALAEMGLRSEITVALVGRQAKLGRLTFGSTRAGRGYGIFDVVTAMDFAQRVSAALDHAVLLQRTRRAASQRDQLLATVSHDLRNPLAAILVGTQGLLAAPAGGASSGSRARLEAIRRSAQRMNRLAEDLLAVAELERGGIALRRNRDSAAELLREVGQLFEPVALQRSQTLTVVVPDPDIAVECDSDRIVQVLSNLIGNALKFTPDGGHIRVEARRRGSDVELSVTDDGPGIRAQDLQRVFEPRWRADPAAQPGMGLGLAIARELVSAHGGRIGAESTLGAGARFFFTLPLSAAAPAPPARPPGRPKGQRRWRAAGRSALVYSPDGEDPVGRGGSLWWPGLPN